MSKSKKKILYDAHSKHVNNFGELYFDELVSIETLKEIGNFVIEKVINDVDFIDYDKYKDVCVVGFNVQIDTDFEEEYAKQVLHLNYLPCDALKECKIIFGELMFKYSQFQSDIDTYNKMLYKEANKIKIEKAKTTKEISKAIESYQNYEYEFEKRNRLNQLQELVNIEIDKSKYTEKFLHSIMKKLTFDELKKISLESCINYVEDDQALSEKISKSFEYYFEMIDIACGHIKARDGDLASIIVKSTVIYDKAMERLQLDRSHYLDGEVSEEKIEMEKQNITLVRSFFENPNIQTEEIRGYIDEQHIIDEIKLMILNTHCLKERKLILDALKLFENQNYEMFINILLVQIEGLLDDLALGMNLEKEKTFTNLRDKIELIFEENSFEYYKYFYYDLNSMRNQIAHGNRGEFFYLSTKEIYQGDLIRRIDSLNKHSFKYLACSLIFDLQFLLHKLLDKLEEKRMLKFFKWEYQIMGRNNIKQSSVELMIENKRFEEYLKWIFNPRYEILHDFYNFKIEGVEIKDIVEKLREILMKEAIWDNVAKKYEDESYDFFSEHLLNIKNSMDLITNLKVTDDNDIDKIKDIRKQFNKMYHIKKNKSEQN